MREGVMKFYRKGAAWVRAHPKITSAIGVAAAAAGSYYGVPPEYSQPALKFVCETLALCPRL
jgi:hypothetical protein